MPRGLHVVGHAWDISPRPEWHPSQMPETPGLTAFNEFSWNDGEWLFSLYRTTLHSLKSQWVRVGCTPASLRRFILHPTNRAVRESKSMWPVKHVHTNSLRKPLLSILCVRSWIVWLSLCLYVLVCVLPRCLFSVLLPHVCPSPQFSSVSCERLMLCALFVPCLVSYKTKFAAFGCTSHLPTCQIVTLSAKNSKNESSSYEPGNSIIYLFCLFSTYNRIELCEVRLNEECIQKLLNSSCRVSQSLKQKQVLVSCSLLESGYALCTSQTQIKRLFTLSLWLPA